MDFITYGFMQVFTLQNFLLMLGGVFFGTVVGAIPGLTATLAISLLIPFTFGMEAIPSLVFLLSIYCGGIYGGCITAILVNAPGTPGAAATLLDGYPMARQGRGGEALGVATISSGIGGFLSTVILILLSQTIAGFALRFSAQEYFAVSVFGLSIIFSLSKDLVKGSIVGVLGVAIGMIGMDPMVATTRFTFGIPKLMAGINILPAVIGVFSVSEVFLLIEQGMKRQAQKTNEVSRILPSRQALTGLVPTWLRSTLIGTFVGLLPGAGANIASFVSYNEARRASKTPERFGTGIPEGVAACETANNAVTGGAMIPMLTLGIPGDAVTAVLLSALTIQGYSPGPLLFSEHMDIVYPIFACLLMANIVLVIIGMLGARPLAKIALIRKEYLVPGIAIFAMIGSFASSGNTFEIWVTLAFGFGGFILKKLDFDVVPLVLGLILGPMAERYLRQALVLSSGNLTTLFTRPISLVLMLLSIVSITAAIIRNSRKAGKPGVEGDGAF